MSPIANDALIGASSGTKGGIFGAAAGGAIGAIAGLINPPKKQKPSGFTALIESKTFWEFAGVGAAIVILIVLVRRK